MCGVFGGFGVVAAAGVGDVGGVGGMRAVDGGAEVRRWRLVAAAGAGAVAAGCAALFLIGGAAGVSPAAGPSSPGIAGGEAPAAGAVAALRAEADELPSIADFCYVEAMIPHHEQAVQMSEILLDADGAWPRAAALAEFIITDQRAEVDTMRAWWDAWGREIAERQGAPAPAPGGHAHGGTSGDGEAGAADGVDAEPGAAAVPVGPVSCGGHGHDSSGGGVPAMRGMMSEEQLAGLAEADGPAASLLFLEMMIPHHEGALEMAREVIASGTNRFTIVSAKHVVDEQAREVAAMTAMLAEAP